MVSALIETEQLAEWIGKKGVVVLDASWHMPSSERDARAEFFKRHIPGARFFDIDAVSDHGTDLPHMLPTADAFAAAVSLLGISNDDVIVVYDTLGIFSAARVWWMFRVYGHENVFVLNGGLPKWMGEGREIEEGEARPERGDFEVHFRSEMVRSMAQIERNLSSKKEQVVDARSPGRFAGSEPEPRPGLASGHIPGSFNVFFKDCLRFDGTMKDADELRALFEKQGVDAAKPVVASCGSGVTACILALAMHEMGCPDVPVYDGSWTEWGAKLS